MSMQPPYAPMTNALPTAPLTTEQIQKLLDENKQLIMMILENQSLGKLAECAQLQALLQKNLMYLAAIADAQPQVQTQPHAVLSQTPIQPALQDRLMHHPQPMISQQQQSNMLASNIPGNLGVRPRNQTQLHQFTPSRLLDPSSFSSALGSQHNYTGPHGSDSTGRKQVGSDK